jgi:hypothetical protein
MQACRSHAGGVDRLILTRSRQSKIQNVDAGSAIMTLPVSDRGE